MIVFDLALDANHFDEFTGENAGDSRLTRNDR